jgi:hypothetical protein
VALVAVRSFCAAPAEGRGFGYTVATVLVTAILAAGAVSGVFEVAAVARRESSKNVCSADYADVSTVTGIHMVTFGLAMAVLAGKGVSSGKGTVATGVVTENR